MQKIELVSVLLLLVSTIRPYGPLPVGRTDAVKFDAGPFAAPANREIKGGHQHLRAEDPSLNASS